MNSSAAHSDKFFANMIDLIEWINEKLPDLPGSLGALVYPPNDSGFGAELLIRLEVCAKCCRVVSSRVATSVAVASMDYRLLRL